MNSFITRKISFLLLLLFLNHPETCSAFRIPFALQITKCSTVAFWSSRSISNSDQKTTTAPLTKGGILSTTTSLDAGTRRKNNNSKVATFKNIEEVLECFKEEPIGVLFGTKSCGPCHSMKEEMKQIHSTFGNELLLFDVDIDRWPSVASKMNVIMAPTLLVFQQGQVQLRLEGMLPAETILKELSAYLGHS
jgi:thiol-disulfide isomerase/thioredoxin